jgi:hypothetical protein
MAVPYMPTIVYFSPGKALVYGCTLFAYYCIFFSPGKAVPYMPTIVYFFPREGSTLDAYCCMIFFFPGKALVYGCTLDAYCCVQTLLAMGIPGENIQLVEPPATQQVNTAQKAISRGQKLGFFKAYWNIIETLFISVVKILPKSHPAFNEKLKLHKYF